MQQLSPESIAAAIFSGRLLTAIEEGMLRNDEFRGIVSKLVRELHGASNETRCSCGPTSLCDCPPAD